MDCFAHIRGKVCMVTGGGGSIGSELVRQLEKGGAEKIVIVDIYENGAYYVRNETERAVVEIASVRDYAKMDYIMSAYKPSVVFHAAAHKHVPFMEQNPEEAVKNNIRGTEITAELSEKYGADSFVFISTDKAVEPVSVMGASKRVGEMMMYDRAQRSKHTAFITVRFGNVIGSEGSVIPLFKKQIERGSLTVTDRAASRYFMTIPQAVSLIMLSLTAAKSGDIFVFDMGESKNILSIAEELCREAGKEPYKDVEIKFTGLRKGDKLKEKLFYDFEKPERTCHDKIMRVAGSSVENLDAAVKKLYDMASVNDREGIVKLIFEITKQNTRIWRN